MFHTTNLTISSGYYVIISFYMSISTLDYIPFDDIPHDIPSQDNGRIYPFYIYSFSICLLYVGYGVAKHGVASYLLACFLCFIDNSYFL